MKTIKKSWYLENINSWKDLEDLRVGRWDLEDFGIMRGTRVDDYVPQMIQEFLDYNSWEDLSWRLDDLDKVLDDYDKYYLVDEGWFDVRDVTDEFDIWKRSIMNDMIDFELMEEDC